MMDPFVRNVALVTFGLLALLFLNTYIGVRLGNELSGVDDVVEKMAIDGYNKEAHPFMKLPGDTEVGAFTIAALGMGMVIGYLWRKLFGERAHDLDSV